MCEINYFIYGMYGLFGALGSYIIYRKTKPKALKFQIDEVPTTSNGKESSLAKLPE
jgi:hypothetical protein